MEVELPLYQRIGMVLLSVAAPRRLAKLFLRVPAQPLREPLETIGQVEPIAFTTGGGVMCRGWWVEPPQGAAGQSDRCVVLVHGWTSHALRLRPFVEPLLQRGYRVMLYHARNHGDSDPYPICSLAQFTEDVAAAVAFARQRSGSVALVGHSLGAAAALVAAADSAPVDAVVALAAPAHPAWASYDVLRTQHVPAGLIMRRIGPHVERFIGRSFDSIAPGMRIREVPCPVLLVHGSADEVIPVSHFHWISREAGDQVETMLMEGADHDSLKTAPEAHQRILAFLERTVPVNASSR